MKVGRHGMVDWLHAWLAAGMVVCMAVTACAAPGPDSGKQAGEPALLVLCYHDVPAKASNDPYGVSVPRLVEQLEYLRTHGYAFVSPEQVRSAAEGKARLPPKPVLISFDDGYVSFASNVVSILEVFKCPAMLAICAGWTESGGPADLTAPLMPWEQVKEVSRHPLVTLASHSYDLHKAVQYNPQGNTAQAATSRIYFPKQNAYETEEQYFRRIEGDCVKAREVFENRVGKVPDILVWPYGEANALAGRAAREAGFAMGFSLKNNRATFDDIMRIDRVVITDNPSMEDFIADIRVRERYGAYPLGQVRGVQIDLDLIYDPSPEQTERNLDAFVERVSRINPNTVYVQGFADADGNGEAEAVYFPNSVLPMRADLLNRVCNQLYVRGYQVYVWMPVLGVRLPDSEKMARLSVRELSPDHGSWRSIAVPRLSPFAHESTEIMTKLYSDLAAHVRFHGIIFEDDGVLSAGEDYHPEAMAAARSVLNLDLANVNALPDESGNAWMRLKTKRLNDFTGDLMAAVRRYRPDTKFARTIFATALLNPASEEWLAQNYRDCLDIYDFVAVMAYPGMEDVRSAGPWLRRLVDASAAAEGGLEKTVFELQAYDWKNHRWIADARLMEWTRVLVGQGARHVAYYPDNFTVDRPGIHQVRKEYSTEIFLFPRPAPGKSGGY